jgi:hypothetical protein
VEFVIDVGLPELEEITTAMRSVQVSAHHKAREPRDAPGAFRCCSIDRVDVAFGPQHQFGNVTAETPDMESTRGRAAAACLSLFLFGVVLRAPAFAQLPPPSTDQVRDIQDCFAKSHGSDSCERAYLVFTTYKAAVRSALKVYGDDPAAMREMAAAIGDVTADLSGERLGPRDLLFLFTVEQCMAATNIVNNAMLRGNDYERARRFSELAVAMGNEALSMPVSNAKVVKMKGQLQRFMTDVRSSRDFIRTRH